MLIIFILFGLFTIAVSGTEIASGQFDGIKSRKCEAYKKEYKSPHPQVFNQPCDYLEFDGRAVNSGSDFCLDLDDKIKESCGKYFFEIN